MGSIRTTRWTYQIDYKEYTYIIIKNETVEAGEGSSYVTKKFDLQEINNSGSVGNGKIDNGIISYDEDRILYFINYARLFLNVKNNNEYIPTSVAYLIIYVALVVFTAVFTMRYIKRVIYIAFLTLMAPMVALTYPLDKIKDRKSTGLEYVV